MDRASVIALWGIPVRLDRSMPEDEVRIESSAARQRERARMVRICRRMCARLFQIMQDHSITPQEVLPDEHR